MERDDAAAQCGEGADRRAHIAPGGMGHELRLVAQQQAAGLGRLAHDKTRLDEFGHQHVVEGGGKDRGRPFPLDRDVVAVGRRALPDLGDDVAGQHAPVFGGLHLLLEGHFIAGGHGHLGLAAAEQAKRKGRQEDEQHAPHGRAPAEGGPD